MATNSKRARPASAGHVLVRAWFPVDPAKIAHDMGLDVFITDLPGKVSGALIKQKIKIQRSF